MCFSGLNLLARKLTATMMNRRILLNTESLLSKWGRTLFLLLHYFPVLMIYPLKALCRAADTLKEVALKASAGAFSDMLSAGILLILLSRQ